MEAGPDRRRGREHASAAGTAGPLMGTSPVSCEGSGHTFSGARWNK